jgi:hypothetical protein
MTIKQQGGIFGRNPSLNDVEIDDLTVTGSSILNGAFSVQGTAGKLNQTVAGNVLQIAKSMGTESAVVQVGGDRSGDGATYIDMFGASGGTFGARFIRNGGTNGSTFLQAKGTGGLVVRTDDAAPVIIQTGAAEAARFNTSGNLAFPSGQGIDFSATSGTGTSELFDDYEEGTWTPTLNAYDGTPTVSGFYTKIGDKVFLECSIELDGTSDASSMRIDGLPFSVNAEQVGGSYITRYSGGATAFYLTFDASNRMLPKTNADASMTYNDVGASALLHLVTIYRAA